MKRTLLYAVVLSVLAACRQPSPSEPATSWEQLPIVASRTSIDGQPLVVCDVAQLTDSINLPLSLFVEDLEIIPLERRDEAYTRNTSIRVSDHYILLHSSRNMPFRLFDRKGKYLCDIGSVSSTAGGYSQIYDFQLDEAHNRIYLMPWNATHLIVYDLQGQLQPSIPLNSPDETCWELPKAVFHVDADRGQVTVATLPWNTLPRMVWTQDLTGRVLSEVPPTPSGLQKDYGYEIQHLYNTDRFEFSFLDFNPQQKDSLYHYNKEENRLIPTFTLRFPGDKLLVHRSEELPTCFVGTIIGRMEEIGLFDGTESRDHTNFIVDKRTLRGGRYHIYNDFLGNIPAYWFPHSRHGYYARNLSPTMLKQELEEGLQRSDLAPAMRQKITGLLQSIDVERDNNYLMIGKLKK